MDEELYPRKVKVHNEEGRLRKVSPIFYLDGVKRALAVKEVGLQRGKQFERERERSVLRGLVRA